MVIDHDHADAMNVLRDAVDAALALGERYGLSSQEMADELRRIANELAREFHGIASGEDGEAD